MDSQVLHKDPVAKHDAHFICGELHVILARFTSLEIDDIETGRLAHIGQSYHDDIEDLSRVISKGLLNESCVDIHSTAKHIGGLFIDFVGYELNWSVLSMDHCINTALLRVELQFVFLHSETFREHLLSHALRLFIDFHYLVLDNKLALFVIQHALANVVLFLLRQNEVVLVESRTTDLLHNLIVSVTLIDQDTVGVKEKP